MAVSGSIIWRNKTQLAAWLCLARQTIYKHLARADAPKPNKNKQYDVKEVAEYIWNRQLSDRKTSDLTLTHEKILTERVNRQKKTIEIGARIGALVDRSEIEKWIGEQFGGLRQRLMALAPVIARRAAKKTATQIAPIVRAELERTTNEFADVHRRRAAELEKKANRNIADPLAGDEPVTVSKAPAKKKSQKKVAKKKAAVPPKRKKAVKKGKKK